MDPTERVDPALLMEACVPIDWVDDTPARGPDYNGGAPHESGYNRAERRRAYREHRRIAARRR